MENPKDQIEKKPEVVEEKNAQETNSLSKSDLISFAFDLGFAIIIPLIIFALGGRLLDKKMDTSPLFLIVGILISLIFTGIAVYKKAKKFSSK